ncbi:hypothetical protein PTSG_03341 [Salpingoeca rosetta]|uniref:Seipin n=1 Tax=Salpingoeca rosetta (strain ATCC 50818 / BSB-021) TaxID=946362 RepID=F2U4W4_SALR5|nr:uncharacterized protein PTSG_03341 [Salpingoeca rosetta]EGD82680.1 hypothetical protein PTSG_03341 [Salpingoeca rosetta]|eukprot:XP_004995916.1 hypothetical protein PTSG_03341 [Salpingoeca rosetta]
MTGSGGLGESRRGAREDSGSRHYGNDAAGYLWHDVLWQAMRVLKWLAIASVVVMAVFAVCYAASVFIYGVTYWWIVPEPEHSWPLYFDYGSKGGQRPLTHVYLSHDTRHALRVGQAYDFTVELELPNSRPNRQAGMFMVSLWLSSTKDDAHASHDIALHQGELTATGNLVEASPGVGGSRPAMLPYRPSIVHFLRRILLAGPYLLGLVDDTQTVTVPVMQHVHVKGRGLHWASVSLSSSKLQVTRATLMARTRMQGMTYWMYHWFLSSFVVGTLMLASALTVGILLLILILIWPYIHEPVMAAVHTIIGDDDAGDHYPHHDDDDDDERARQETQRGLVYNPELDMDVLPGGDDNTGGAGAVDVDELAHRLQRESRQRARHAVGGGGDADDDDDDDDDSSNDEPERTRERQHTSSINIARAHTRSKGSHEGADDNGGENDAGEMSDAEDVLHEEGRRRRDIGHVAGGGDGEYRDDHAQQSSSLGPAPSLATTSSTTSPALRRRRHERQRAEQ